MPLLARRLPASGLVDRGHDSLSKLTKLQAQKAPADELSARTRGGARDSTLRNAAALQQRLPSSNAEPRREDLRRTPWASPARAKRGSGASPCWAVFYSQQPFPLSHLSRAASKIGRSPCFSYQMTWTPNALSVRSSARSPPRQPTLTRSTSASRSPLGYRNPPNCVPTRSR